MLVPCVLNGWGDGPLFVFNPELWKSSYRCEMVERHYHHMHHDVCAPQEGSGACHERQEHQGSVPHIPVSEWLCRQMVC